jgi:uncharacterized cupin superfamily protein
MKRECVIRGAAESPNWKSCPINPDWVLEGTPVARVEHLSSSADGAASTYYWDCTAGRFDWHYSFDETLHILEGEVLLKFPNETSRAVAAGDVVFFPAGSTAQWTIDQYVRKLAYCRTPLPAPLLTIRSAIRAIKRLLQGRNSKQGSPGIFPN